LPPPVAVAVKVTADPLHILVADAVIVTSGVTDGFTVIVIGAAVAVATDGQVADEVITTVTTSPLARAVVLKVLAFEPTLLPFTFHW
jgi:hypothetical protein